MILLFLEYYDAGLGKNQLNQIAQIFKEVLDKYNGTILNFYFAILNMTNDNYIIRNRNKNDRKNIDIFKDIFI